MFAKLMQYNKLHPIVSITQTFIIKVELHLLAFCFSIHQNINVIFVAELIQLKNCILKVSVIIYDKISVNFYSS